MSSNGADTDAHVRLWVPRAGLRKLEARVRRLLAPGAAREKQLRAVVRKQRRALSRLRSAVAEILTRLDNLERQRRSYEQASELRMIEHQRLGFQFGSIEQRLGRIEQQLTDGVLVATDDDTAEARSILDEVRREHEQVRVRMQIISSYEERLRRVEAALDRLDSQDPRYQV